MATAAAVLAAGSPRRRAPVRAHAAGSARAPARAASGGAGAPLDVSQQRQDNRRILSYTSYISLGTSRKRELALTFDDGPGPYTPAILALLERLHVKATFLEIGRQVSEFPQLTARLASRRPCPYRETDCAPAPGKPATAGSARSPRSGARAL